MLAPIVRALVGVPQERLGVLFDTINKIGGADGELWRTRFAEVLREGVKGVPLSPEVLLDTLIRVDRSIRPVYPDWVETVMHPEFELTGPADYYLGTIDPWLHDGQKNDQDMEGNDLYKYLKEKKMLESCLSLRDGEEIQRRGIDVFDRFFKDKSVFLWKSVVQDHFGQPFVPFLYARNGQLVVVWDCLSHRWKNDRPALRFVS